MKQDSYVTSSPASPPTVCARTDSTPSQSRGEETFQDRVLPWMLACFGSEISGDRIERNHRFLEEALELVQACGCTEDEARQLVAYVYGRPVGESYQEVGGVMVTLAALCLAQKLDMHKCGELELGRIWTKVEKIRAKQAAKPKHSPLPGPSVSDEHTSCEDPKGLSGEAMPARSASAETPHPSPVDYTEVVERLRAEARDWRVGPVVLDAAQVIEAQAAEIERLKQEHLLGTAFARIAELEKERDRKDDQIDKLLQHCPDAECSTCSEIICPHGDDLHFHHDGCPSCYTEECRALSTGGDSHD